MTRTRLLNVAGIAVALVLMASWALGTLWSEHRPPAAAARTAPTTAAATATGTPDAARVQPLRPKARRPHSAAADPTTASVSATAAAHHATAHHTAGSHHSSGSGGPTSSPSAHPTSGGSSTPTPSPTPSQDVLSQILGGLTHLPH